MSYGSVIFDGVQYPVDSATLRLDNSDPDAQSISITVDARTAGGGYFQLDAMDFDLPPTRLIELSSLHEQVIHWQDFDPLPDDTVGSCSDDLDTSGWYFPEYEQDRPDFLAYGWYFIDMRICFENLGKDRFNVVIHCKLQNMEHPTTTKTASCDLIIQGVQTKQH